MRMMKRTLITVAAVLMVFSISVVSGALVRNIHHPLLQPVKNQVLWLVDLPKDIYREFVLGLETRNPRVPASVAGAPFDSSLVNGPIITIDSTGDAHQVVLYDVLGKPETRFRVSHPPIYVNQEKSFYYYKEGDLLGKVSIRGNEESPIWIVNLPYQHHEIHIDDEGNVYAPIYFPMDGSNGKPHDMTRKFEATLLRDNAPPFEATNDVFREDGFIVISSDGKTLLKQGLTDIFVANNMLGLIAGAGGLEVDPYHLNSVVPALKDYGNGIHKGDILLSLRNRSMLTIYRPSTGEIVWHKVGPWMNQHSAKFDTDGNIYMFNNNVLETQYARRRETGKFLSQDQNQILKYDFKTGQVENVEGCTHPKDVWTVTGGNVYKTDDYLIETFSNHAVQIFCNLRTKKFTAVVPEVDVNNRVKDLNHSLYILVK